MAPVKGFGVISTGARRWNAALRAPVDFDRLVVDGPGAARIDREGGKAAGIARLSEAGLATPPTRVIQTTTFLAFLEHCGLPPTRPEDPEAVMARIRKTPLPPGWEDRLIAEARALGPWLAVRSSGAEEDGAQQSFAGIHHTALGVRPHQIADAIREVWASAFASPAAAYTDTLAPMAVVLQPMIEPTCAGVVFTVNPQTGSWREMVVEAVRGQGEALVSGRQAPQWALVRRPRDLPGRRVWNRLRLAVIQSDAVAQEVSWTLDDGVLKPEAVPPEEQSRPLLSSRQLLALCRSCLKAEAAFGEPLDIEWCLQGNAFVFLQARPITRVGTPRERDVLWTRRFIGERFPVPPTPLSWSLLSPVLAWFIGYPSVQERFLGGGPPLRRVSGHPYLNTTVFRHLLFKLPGAPAPGFMLELIPPDEVDDWRRRFRVKADWTVYRAIFATTWRERRWERFAFNPFTNHKVWDAFLERLQAELSQLDLPVIGPGDALQRVEAQQALVRDYLSVHVTSLLFANLWYQLLDSALASWAPGSSAGWMERLAVCPPGNKTLETNQALYTLGQLATERDLQALAGGVTPSEPFASALSDFLDQYGHRAEASWEIFSPRWADDPSRLCPLLGHGTAPHERAGAQERIFTQAKRELLAAVPGLKGWVLDGLVFFTRRYLLLRENQRFAFDRLLASQQRTLLSLGAVIGLDDPGDIQWLSWEEVVGRIDGSLPGFPDLEARRAQHAKDCATVPPVFLRGEVPVDEGLVGSRLQGLGISPGRARGRVRILDSAASGGALLEGEILVASAIDPGWTPLLLRAGGVVLELGSLLSHGAVVAREYGVPGVVNLSGITRVLKDGQEVTVDGTRGLLWIHDATS